jgi:hypothetical protein
MRKAEEVVEEESMELEGQLMEVPWPEREETRLQLVQPQRIQVDRPVLSLMLFQVMLIRPFLVMGLPWHA